MIRCFEHWVIEKFGFVSYFVLRISDLTSLVSYFKLTLINSFGRLSPDVLNIPLVKNISAQRCQLRVP